MTVMTGFSGNEMLCLALKGFKPGDIVIGTASTRWDSSAGSPAASAA